MKTLAAIALAASVAAPSLADARCANASYYGATGNRTASGEGYTGRSMTAAHRSLRFGTRVRVTNLGNGRSAVVRINDRGPFIRGRIIDVSVVAADALGMRQSGTACVRLAVLK